MSKIRVVFNALGTSSSFRSLNVILCRCPKLQTDVGDILLHIQLHKYILPADIVKTYRQILIHPGDRLYSIVYLKGTSEKRVVKKIIISQ